MKKLILFIIFSLLAFIVTAYSTSIMLAEVGQLGASDKTQVSKYNIRVYSILLSVDKDQYNNRIISITITIASSITGTYNIYATVTSGSCSATASWSNVPLTTTPTTLSSPLSRQCTYTTPGATVEVRGEPA
jgi:hypothetical protein